MKKLICYEEEKCDKLLEHLEGSCNGVHVYNGIGYSALCPLKEKKKTLKLISDLDKTIKIWERKLDYLGKVALDEECPICIRRGCSRNKKCLLKFHCLNPQGLLKYFYKSVENLEEAINGNIAMLKEKRSNIEEIEEYEEF